jgi:hypothetical protein
MLVHWVVKVKRKFKDIFMDRNTEFRVTLLHLRYKMFNVTDMDVLLKIKIYSVTLLLKFFQSNPAKYLIDVKKAKARCVVEEQFQLA